MRRSREKEVTTFIRTHTILDGAALHELCDNLCCTSFCQTNYIAIKQPSYRFGGFSSMTAHVQDRRGFKFWICFCPGLFLSIVPLISWSCPRDFAENFRLSKNWAATLPTNMDVFAWKTCLKNESLFPTIFCRMGLFYITDYCFYNSGLTWQS